MDAITFLEKQIPKLLSTELLIKSLVFISPNGATLEEINADESKIGMSISKSYRQFLHRWNGLDLDVIRFFGVGNVNSRIKNLAEQQDDFLLNDGIIFLASSPTGFLFGENREGHIYSFDTDGGEIEFICQDFDSFVTGYLFSKDSDRFMGNEWRESLTAIF